MKNQEHSMVKKETFINIRKLAALDIVFHGSWFILGEFALGVAGCAVGGAFSLSIFFHTASHPLFAAILGFALSWIALNYVPLLLYAIKIVRRKSAELEVAFELERKGFYALKYTFQSALLLLPLVVPILAIAQEIQKRSRLHRADMGIEEINQS
jgi:hypothetical protein